MDVATDVVVRNDNEEGCKLTFHSGCQHWTVARYNVVSSTCLNARCFSAMFLDGRGMAMLDRRRTLRDTDTGAWERFRNAMKLWCSWYMRPIAPFEMLFVRHDHRLDHFHNLRRSMAQKSDFRRMSNFKLVCFRWSCDWLNLTYDALDWWWELHIEGLHLRGSQHLRF